MKERARQEYLNRMKDEFNKKREYKKLIQERKKYIEQVIENRDELFQKYNFFFFRKIIFFIGISKTCMNLSQILKHS